MIRLIFSLRVLTLVILIITISACGFHLRGTQQSDLKGVAIHVQSENSFGEFEKALSRQLKASEALIAENIESADLVINLGKLNFQTQGASRDSTGRANQIILSGIIFYQMTKTSIKNLDDVKTKELKVSRSYYQDYRNPISEQSLKQQTRLEIIEALAMRLTRQAAWQNKQLSKQKLSTKVNKS